MKKITIILSCLTLLYSCNNEKMNADASGAFEAEETIISAEAAGTLKEFKVQEGQQLKQGQQYFFKR